MKKEITYEEILLSNKTIKELIIENREWLLGRDGLNYWEWFIDAKENLILISNP